MLIDTHAHLNFKDFDKDRDEVIKRSLEQDTWMINASSTFSTSKLAVSIAEKYQQGIYAAVGLHPIHVKDEAFDAEQYRQLAQSKKVVAIGETGLDFMYANQQAQKELFLQHLKLAKELNLPVIFHCRKAHDDMLKVLQSSEVKELFLKGVVHCFTGRWSQAKQYLEMGLYLGFNGIIYKMDLDEAIKKTPLDKMLIETDCPFLCPSEALAKEGWRHERNEPIYVKYIAQRIAEVRGEPFEKMAEITTQNAKRLFNI